MSPAGVLARVRDGCVEIGRRGFGRRREYDRLRGLRGCGARSQGWAAAQSRGGWREPVVVFLFSFSDIYIYLLTLSFIVCIYIYSLGLRIIAAIGFEPTN